MGALDKLANKLYGGNRLEVSASLASVDTYTYLAEAVSDSEDGLVSIVITDDVTQAEGIEDDGEWLSADELSTAISVPTTVSVKAGDVVMVTASGAEVLNPMVVTGVVGRGDEQAAEVDDAVSKAGQALTIAEATGQHFWPDDDGIHVTEVTEDEWKDKEGPHFHSGMNVLINSLGQLFRNGINNLLELFPAGLRLYDGNGNNSTNLLAEFGPRNVSLASQYSETAASQEGSISFFGGRTKLLAESERDTNTSSERALLRTEKLVDDADATILTSASHAYMYENQSNMTAEQTISASVSDAVGGFAQAYIRAYANKSLPSNRYSGEIDVFADSVYLIPASSAGDAIQPSMLEVVNELRTATKTLTLTNLGGSPQLALTRRGHWVLAHMNNLVNPSSANTNISCGTVPSGYRPTKNAFYSGIGVIGTTLGGFFRWRVAPAGTITFICSATGNRECQLLMYWYTNDAWPTS